MRNKFKKVIVSMLAVCALILGTFGVACAKTEEETLQISFEKESVSLELFESETLVLQTKDVEGVVYESSDPEVVSVSEDGVATALKEGSATITATAGKAKATCVVTVNYDGSVPVLSVKKEIRVRIGQTYSLAPTFAYKNVVRSDVDFSYIPKNGEIASVDRNGTLTANAVGETEITVSGTWQGFTSIPVKVKVVVFDDVVFYLDERTLDLYASDPLGEGLKTDGLLTAYGSDSSLKEPTKLGVGEVVWESSDENVAVVSNGFVEAVSGGNAEISASYTVRGTAYTNTVKVTVFTPVVEKNVPVMISSESVSVALSETGIESAESVLSVSVTANGETKETEFGISGDLLSLDFETVPFGESSLEIKTQKVIYAYPLVKATKIIRTKADFNARFDYNGGYVVLGNNIDLAGEDITTYSETWTGTFNGMGYSVFNYNIKGYTDGNGNACRPTLFPTIAENGTVKNLAVVGVTVWQNYDGNKLGGAGITNSCEGTLENIFAQGKVTSHTWVGNTNSTVAMVARMATATATIQNVFGVMEAEGGKYNDNGGAVVVGLIADNQMLGLKISNVYSINLSGNNEFSYQQRRSAIGNNASGNAVNMLPYGDATITTRNTTDTDLLESNGKTSRTYKNVLSFQTLDQFKNKQFGNGDGDRSPYIDLTAFTGGYWDATGEIPVFKSVKNAFVPADGNEIFVGSQNSLTCAFADAEWELKFEYAGVTLQNGILTLSNDCSEDEIELTATTRSFGVLSADVVLKVVHITLYDRSSVTSTACLKNGGEGLEI